jgi:hypothetical protein
MIATCMFRHVHGHHFSTWYTLGDDACFDTDTQAQILPTCWVSPDVILNPKIWSLFQKGGDYSSVWFIEVLSKFLTPVTGVLFKRIAHNDFPFAPQLCLWGHFWVEAIPLGLEGSQPHSQLQKEKRRQKPTHTILTSVCACVCVCSTCMLMRISVFESVFVCVCVCVLCLCVCVCCVYVCMCVCVWVRVCNGCDAIRGQFLPVDFCIGYLMEKVRGCSV